MPADHHRDPTAETRTVDLPEGRIHVTLLGEGPPILFLHGVSARGRSWEAVAREVVWRRQVRAWIPDLLGRGTSGGAPTLRFRLDDETRRVEALIDRLAASEAGRPGTLVGHSTGAAIALAVASRCPDIRGLVLSNPVAPDVRRPAVLGLLRSGLMRKVLASIFSPLHRPLGALVLRRAGGPGYRPSKELVEAYAGPYADRRRAEILMRILADWRPSELEGNMPRRSVATRVVAGTCDPRIPVESARGLARTLEATFTLVEHGGHILPEQHPEQLAREVGALLEALGS